MDNLKQEALEYGMSLTDEEIEEMLDIIKFGHKKEE
jgi:hypothetical protein